MHPLLSTGDGDRTVILAHGAGAPMDSDFMNAVAKGLATAGLRCVRFEFPYMAQRRVDGKKRGPNTAAVLLATWREVVAQVAGEDAGRLIIGGKSMGGRIATMVADELGVAGVVCLGYPFHPPGKPEKLRTEHLRAIETPVLVVQGERDTFGARAEVATYDLSAKITFAWAPDGDHSLKPRKRSGHTMDENLEQAIEAIVEFIADLP